ncbi:hypothetical protein LTR84_007461 [Exophiala bonariae]|uniref:Erythromycin biosynthesis protein CIII-like C-terminal domain-containing protein n=1 Tax=Exophiala bonariae TaxID=1690606 RepID=A0AAV9MYC1_9EURO|nr:hypothetical protein LTR84_007461 [Exophiala bonariae]
MPDPDTEEPFVANAIIANPPSFAHVHCAEALGIPLHIIFTMPWTPTRAYSHPLANVRNNNTDPRMGNYVSYGMVQLLTWNGIGDVVQRWRRSIDLEPLPASEAPFIMESLEIPHTYCWSPALVPKPRDWGKHIDVCGFLFRDMPSYSPPSELETFLNAGPPPVYIGFGSIVVDDPESLIKTVLEAVDRAGVRAIVSKGWSNLASSGDNDKIYFIGDCPHEWLFQQVAAVVHHGGAGTTACGLLNGRPTTIVPFFGDQPFWGKMVATAKAGADPIPYKSLNSENLSQAIRYCLTTEAQEAAAGVAEKMKTESGVKTAIESFHRNLPMEKMGCDLIPSLPATWIYTKSKNPIKLSGAAAEILLQSHTIKSNELSWYKSKPIHIENRRWDVVSGTVSSGIGLNYDLLNALSGVYRNPREMYKNKEKQRSRAVSTSGASGSNVGAEDESSDLTTLEVAKMVGASARGLSQFTAVAVRGLLADVPVAVSEGLRNTPKLYGQKVPDHAPVTDWKSGITVAGTNFAQQMSEGLSDLIVQPAKGVAKDGALGFGKGLAKGVVQTLTKPTGAALGLVGYTSQGIYKSIRSAVHSKTKKSVASAARVRDKYHYHAHKEYIDAKKVMSEFARLAKKSPRSDPGDESGTVTPNTTASETRPSTSRSRSTNDVAENPDSAVTLPYSNLASPSYSAPSFDNAQSSNPRRPSIARSISNADSERAMIHELYSPVSNSEPDRTPVYELESPSANSEHSQSSSMLAVTRESSIQRKSSIRKLKRVPVPNRAEVPVYELGPSSPRSETALTPVPPAIENPATSPDTHANSIIPTILEPVDNKKSEKIAHS